MLAQAEKAHRHNGHFRLSVFADKLREGEEEAALIDRLLDAAEVSGILRANNPKYWFCQRAGDLLDDGFKFVKDGYPGEVPEHWSIDLGNTPSLHDTEKLAGHLTGPGRWDS